MPSTYPTSPPLGSARLALSPTSLHHSSAGGGLSGAGAVNDTELAFAELELLGQNQRKLASLTSRMTTILSGFDKRLVKLESSILPIHRSTQKLTRLSDNIDSTLATLDKTLSHYDVVQDEEPLIRKGPRPDDIRPYMDTIDRVRKGLEYLKRSDLRSQERVMQDMHNLIETGARKLSDIVRDWVAAESEPIDPNDYILRAIPLPTLSNATSAEITPILHYLQTLPPHQKFDPFGSSIALFADIRGAYMDRSVAPLGQRVLEYCTERVGGRSGAAAGMAVAFHDEDEDVGYRRGSAGVMEWIAAMIEMAENEEAILAAVVHQLASMQQQQSALSRLLRPTLRSFSTTCSSIHSHIRRHLSTHTFFAFDLLGALSAYSVRYDGVMIARCGRSRDESELGDIIHALRGTAMQVFPKFIEDVKRMPREREGEVPSTTVNEISYTGLQYVRQLADYRDVVGPLLQTLGDGNWMIGSSAPPSLGLMGIEGDDTQRGIVSNYLNDVLATILSALEARSRAIRQPSTASIFLLNNVGHLRRELSLSSIIDLFGSTGDELLTTAMRSANTAYLDAWGPVVSPLMEEGLNSSRAGGKGALGGLGGGSERNAVKDRFAKFYEGLDDLERLHRAYPISKEDGELKDRLKNDVVRLVCPLYGRFLAKHKSGDFSKNPQKHIRMTEQEVEDRLVGMFR